MFRSSASLFLGTFLACNSFAQTHEWSFSFGSSQYERAYGVELDPSGNVYICGAFDNTVDFDPDSVGTALITEEGNGDAYLAKYSNAGQHIWSHNIGSWGHDLGSDMVVDDQGDIYITGYFRVDTDFDLGPDTAILSAIGTRDVFVAKYDTDGNYLWAFNIAYGGNVERYPAIGLDPAGNVLLTGEFGGTQDFDPGAGVSTITSNGNQDVFIAKYDNAGGFLWAKAMGGAEFDRGMDIAADSQGDIYVTGMIRDVADMDGGLGVSTITSNGGWDSFLVKYSASGNHLWSFGFGGGGSSFPNESECGMDLSVGADDNVVLVGYYTGAPDMDPGPGQSLLGLDDDKNGYVAKYDGAGNHLWSFGLPDAGEGQANSVAVDPSGQVYVTGFFDGIVDFDPGAGNAPLVGWDIYVAKYTENGDYVWAMRAGDSAYDGGWGIAVDDTANVYVTGVFYGMIDLDPDTSAALHDHVGGRDVFVAKYSPCYRTIQNADFCSGSSYTLPDGTITTSGGVYPTSYAVNNGCDSVITIILDEVVLDTSVTIASGTLTVAQFGAQYQWLDCDNGNTPVPGATLQSFSPTTSGSYSISVQANGCDLISSCHVVSSLGVNEAVQAQVELYPNPTSGMVYIEGGAAISSVHLFNATGQELSTEWTERSIDLAGIDAGVYHVHISYVDGGSSHHRLVVE